MMMIEVIGSPFIIIREEWECLQQVMLWYEEEESSQLTE